MSAGKRLVIILVMVVFCPLVLPALWMAPRVPASAPEPVDSLVSLLSAQSVQLIEKNGVNYRKVTGPARFLHNNTYLICDTALWNVSNEQIDAMGHVKILQNETVLTSDRLIYLIPQDLAQFRGSIVQLEDKDHNTLRTQHLDYNTKDSVAVFQGGGSMRDKDGQIIESLTGTYDSKAKLFTFTDNVNMFTDSIFVKTSRLEYRTDLALATFGFQTDAWKDDDMLSSNAGWYDRGRELFLFYKDVHGLTDERESWSDSLYFWRNLMDVEMLGHVQLTDTVQNVSAVAGRIYYQDSLDRVTLTRDPAIVGLTSRGKDQPADTAYIGADTLIYRTVMKFQIPEESFKVSETRLANLAADAVTAYRRKAAEEAAKAAEEARMKDPNYAAEQEAKKKAEQAAKAKEEQAAKAKAEEEARAREAAAKAAMPKEPAPVEEPEDTLDSAAADSLAAPSDSLKAAQSDSLAAPADSLSTAQADSLAAPADSLFAKAVESPDEALDESSSEDVPADTLDVPEPEPVRDPVADSLAAVRQKFLADSTARADSLHIADSLARIPKDSTKIGFLTAINNVKLFREDIQMCGDSLEYCDIDSLVRLYKQPLIWNEIYHQYTADSLHISFNDGGLDKAYLMSNAFVIIQEDTLAFDQVRSAEMLAYFDEEGSLSRFDALGDADLIFYLQEDSTFATVNRSSAKMLMAGFKKGAIDKVYYFDQVKNNASPLAQMKTEERSLKGFNWQPELRPKSPRDVTSYKSRPSERKAYRARPRASFKFTDLYFPGYMKGVYKSMKEKEAAKARRARERELAKQREADSLAQARLDSIEIARLDSLHVVDSLKAVQDSLKAVQDSLGALKDSLKSGGPAVKDSLGTVSAAAPQIDPKEQKRLEREKARKEREAAREARNAAREAEWARLDSLDAAKEQLKIEKKAEQARQRKLKVIRAQQRQARKDLEKLEKYRQKFIRRKAREDAIAARKAERKARREAAKSSRAPLSAANRNEDES